MENKLTHFDTEGNAVMVDVSEKEETTRTATASGVIKVNDAVMEAVLNKTVQKGDVLGVARVAGIMAAKQTPHLIPMCHPLLISKCSIDFETDAENNQIKAFCTVKIKVRQALKWKHLQVFLWRCLQSTICARLSINVWKFLMFVLNIKTAVKAGNL